MDYIVNVTDTVRNKSYVSVTSNTESFLTNKTVTTIRSVSTAAVAASPNWSSVLSAVIQWVIFVLGTIGNLLVVIVLTWQRSKNQLVTQLFVISLSLSGLALMFSSAWEQALQYINADWRFGKLCCQIQYYLQGSTVFISVWTLAFLAFERLDVHF
jgi:7 transmembrane receptor (rhodopsin family)